MMEATGEIDVRREVLDADARIRPHVLVTPVEHSIYLSHLIEGTVYLKLDLQQTTGSFKFRDPASKQVLPAYDLRDDERVVARRSRNHAPVELLFGASTDRSYTAPWSRQRRPS